MSGYWYPLLEDRQNHIFKPGSTFEQAKMLYEFDSHLRRIWLNLIEPSNKLPQDLIQLFSLYPSVYPGALGFPQSWQQEALWK